MWAEVPTETLRNSIEDVACQALANRIPDHVEILTPELESRLGDLWLTEQRTMAALGRVESFAALLEAERHARALIQDLSVAASQNSWFHRWEDLALQLRMIRESTAYLLGVEIGKRLGGGR